jgi:HAMP domain-containing protein
MQNWKISTRLAAAFGMLVVLLLGVAGAALLQLSTLNAVTKQITSNNLISVELINKLGADMIQARLLELRHVYNESPEYKASIEQQMTKLQGDMDDIKARYAPLVDSPAERSAYETLLAQRKEYVVLMERLFRLSRSGESDKAREFMNGESLQLYNASSATLDTLLEINTNDANSESRKADAAFSNGVWVMGVAVLLALALSVTAGLWITRSIRTPLQRAVALADRVAGGDLSSRIEVHTTDELGQLFSALQRMQSVWQRRSGQCAATEAWPPPAARSPTAMPICPAAPKSRPARWKKQRPPWKSWAPPCARMRRMPAKPTSWPARRPMWRCTAAMWWARW